MHIEPGLVDGAKIALSYATACAAGAVYGAGFEALPSVASFGVAYLVVLLIEPLVDLAVLAGAKVLRGLQGSALVTPRLHHAA